jgi:phage gp16-like protein
MKLLEKRNIDRAEDNKRRNRLLSILHIAKKDLNWSERFYRELLELNFRVPTAAALSNDELIRLIKFIMNEWDWRPKWRGKKTRTSQITVLRQRILSFVSLVPDGERRIQGLCRKFCGMDRVEWCCDVNKLKKILAALGNIKRKEDAGQ